MNLFDPFLPKHWFPQQSLQAPPTKIPQTASINRVCVLNLFGSHSCDATALRIRAYTNVQRTTAQIDVTEKVQAKFHNRLVTPLDPYAELFGDVAPGVEKTLKVKLHYWRDGVVKYHEFPQDSALGLTGN